jgi:putative ABC transport system permease protein
MFFLAVDLDGRAGRRVYASNITAMTQDLVYAVRSFRRSPAFTAVALLSLALGIGATCAIFSVIYGVLIAPYPYARPDEIWSPEIVSLDHRSARGYLLDELPRVKALPVFSDVMATSGEPVLMTGEFGPESFGGVLLTGNAFNFLGVPPIAGRTIQPSDIRSDGSAEPVVVLSYKLWLRLFDGSPAAIGRTLTLNGRPHTIIGVMPPRFGWYGSDGFWLPLEPARRDLFNIATIMRLAPGVSKQVAEQQLDAFTRQLARERPATFPAALTAQGFTTTLYNYLDITVASGDMQTSLRVLMGAVAFLLLIACANVANLQLARGSARAREIAIRISIGAGRRRLLRQLLTESVLLSIGGGLLGVALAFVAIRVIVGLMPDFYVPNESRVTINTTVLLFSFALSVLTGVVFGLVPALQGSRPDVTHALKASRATGAGTQGRRTRDLLVVVEVALSVVLLVGSALMVRTFLALQATDAGIRVDHVIAVGVPLPPAKYATLDQRNRFAQELLDRVAALPGVEAATFGLPFGGPQSTFAIAGAPGDPSRRLTVNLAGADHLRVYGIPLRAGRMFDASEVRRGDRVAVVNETAAKLWPAGQNPVGARVRLGALERPPSRSVIDASQPPEVTIVGVIADTKNAGLRDAPSPVVVMPYTVVGTPQRTLALRSAADPNLQLNPVRAAVREIDHDQPLGRPFTLAEVLSREVEQPRFTMVLFGVFAAVGLALAAAGIYSVLSFHVTRRTHEMGVRLALGAPRTHLAGLLLTMGGRLVLIGLAVGIPASAVAARLLESQLFGVQSVDPLAYAAVAALLLLVAFVACYLPARRAAGVDPLIALRQD